MNNIEFKDVEQKVAELAARVAKIETIDDIPGKKAELAKLEKNLPTLLFGTIPKKQKRLAAKSIF